MEKPFILQFFEVLQWRTHLTQKEKEIYYASNLGYLGEVDFIEIIGKYIPDNWLLLVNLHFDVRGRIQIDAIVITDCSILQFEVKNFTSNYYVRNGQWYKANHERLTYNPFSQMQRAYENLLIVLEDNNLNVPIEPKIVLINENETVSFDDGPDSRILCRWELQKFIRNTIKENYNNPNKIDRLNIQSLLLKMQTGPYNSNEEYLKNREIQKGIVCLKCQDNQTKHNTRHHIECKHCGYKEAKSKALRRTICEYSVLYPNQAVKGESLINFIATPGSERSIRRILYTEFQEDKIKHSQTYNLPNKLMEFVWPNRKFIHYDYDNDHKIIEI